jgi:hypothetical protein
MMKDVPHVPEVEPVPVKMSRHVPHAEALVVAVFNNAPF